MRHMVVVEAGSKQDYVFATNKRREAVGASELIHRVGGKWLDDALSSVPGVEVVLRVSGLATLLVTDRVVGRKVVEHVTRRALEQASGLDVYGWVSGEVEVGTAEQVRDAQALAFEGLAEVRARRPSPLLRHLRLPVLAECETSGLPAAGWLAAKGGGPRSRQSLDKLKVADQALKRMAVDLGREVDVLRHAVDALEDLDDWVAVIHADGNGLGQVFTAFDSGSGDAKVHIPALRMFSAAVDRATKDAVKEAVHAVGEEKAFALPIVVGGDDVTLVCHGRAAIPLAAAYLRAFEALTAADGVIASRTQAMLGRPGLTAAAGIAISKPHFPFSIAYQVAESLCGTAKSVSKHPGVDGAVSALDFHILRDSSPTEAEHHRALHDGARPVRRPFAVLTGLGSVASDGARAWLDRRDFAQVEEPARSALTAGLARSALYRLREALPAGADAADDAYRQMKLERGLDDASLLGPSLFTVDPGQNGAPSTLLGDVLDLSDLEWPAAGASPA